MSIRVTDFKWEKGKNDVKYIELLEKTLKNEQVITARAVAKIRILVTENEKLKKEKQEIRAKTIDEFAEELNKKISEFVLEHKDNLDFACGISAAWNMVDEIWMMKSLSG